MAKFTSGTDAANYVFSTIIPKIRDCAKGISPDLSPRERMAAQIDCVLRTFKKV